MTDKIVTYGDLEQLREMRDEVLDHYSDRGPAAGDLLDRLIAAAEADRPPLPEGWYWLREESGDRRLVRVQPNGDITVTERGSVHIATLDSLRGGRDRLTPLRPTITEADVEKAAQAIGAHRRSLGTLNNKLARAAFEAAGVVIES